MAVLAYPRDFQAVRYLPFCYLCGRDFTENDDCDGDHVPPKTVFAKADRFPLVLKTHRTCNNAHHLLDEKMGQLIGLKRGYRPSDPKHRHLHIRSDGNVGAVINVDVHGAIRRWIRGFHAALYRQPFPLPMRGALEAPFPNMRMASGSIGPDVVRPQHRAFVEAIKLNRAKRNVDRIVSNNGKMRYECVWAQADNNGPWLCIYALDIYAWKDLGDPRFAQRGCAGFYHLPNGSTPPGATLAIASPIVPPNLDPLDPFGR